MKTEYERENLRIVEFESDDIILTSALPEDKDNSGKDVNNLFGMF